MEHGIESSIRFDILVGEGHEDVVLSAGPVGHVFVLIVKFVVTGLGAPDQLGKRVVLKVDKEVCYGVDYLKLDNCHIFTFSLLSNGGYCSPSSYIISNWMFIRAIGANLKAI